MSLIYLWKSAGCSPQQARARFTQVLRAHCDSYRQAFGHAFTSAVHQIDTLLIGQISFDMGVNGWRTWVEAQDGGIVWAGVCETYLGAAYQPDLVRETLDTLERRPATLANWDGRFAACTWRAQGDQVLLTTGATESPTLWHVEGPHGWAAGSRAAPLLELVGRQPELDRQAASLYMAYGFLLGDNALFQGVARLPTRRQVSVGPNRKPTIHTYLSLGDYLEGPGQADRVARGTERMLARVSRQLAHSAEPHLLLTGGRDSRCIAAVAVKAGYSGTAHTSGPDDSVDVQIAAKVAHALGIAHERIGPADGSPMRAMADAPEQVLRWTTISEGAETIRHAVPFPEFFRRRLPFPARRQQVFHGLHTFGNSYYAKGYDLDGPYLPAEARAIVARKVPGSLRLHTPIDEPLAAVCDRLDHEAEGMSLTLAQWLNLVYWQRKCLQWGEDVMSVKDLIDWHWTPLLDRTIIQLGWDLKIEERLAKRLFQDITLRAAPALKGLPYDTSPSGAPLSLSKIARRISKELGRYRKQPAKAGVGHTTKVPADEQLLRFWNEVLFSPGDHAWRELIDEEQLRQIVSTNPSSNTLWSVATIELVSQSFCQS